MSHSTETIWIPKSDYAFTILKTKDISLSLILANTISNAHFKKKIRISTATAVPIFMVHIVHASPQLGMT